MQAVLLDMMTEAEREQWNRFAIEALNAVFPEVPDTEYADWKQRERLLPHALLCLQRAGTADESLTLASLAHGAAQYLYVRGRYAQAEPLYQRALCIREYILDPDHSDVAISLYYLAEVSREQGKYAQVEALHQRALHIWEQALGPDHPRVATSLTGLGLLYWQQGKDAQAEALYQRALYIWEQTLGPDHPYVTFSLTGLAELYTTQGEYAQAEALYQRSLHIWEQTLASGHPHMAISLNGLARLYTKQGKYVQAEALYQRTLSIQEHYLVQDHPETAQTLHDLAILRQKQGNLSEAVSLTERALKIRAQALGTAHLKTVAVQTLYTQLIQEQSCVQGDMTSERSSTEILVPLKEECQADPLHEAMNPSLSGNDPLQGFLGTCCKLHPRAWCRSADLWQAYEDWIERQQEGFPLSRGAFIAHLKVHGCYTDRTKAARIWRGIALVDKNDDGG